MKNSFLLIFLVVFFVGCVSDTKEIEKNPDTHLILITDNGYEPFIWNIKKGDTVEWYNTINTKNWPASDIHPTHTQYPGSDINNCPSKEIFDACKAIGKDETYTFTFNENGTWNYHDHLNYSLVGTIVVE